MFTFQAAFIASLAGGAVASGGDYAGYESLTVVSDHAAIAGDQARIEYYLGFPDETNFQIAEGIYAQGGNSKSYAEITLTTPLTAEVQKGKSITGKTASGATVQGKALTTYAVDSPIVGMQYQTSNSNLDYVQCRRGGLPADDEAVIITGCLNDNAANGVLEVSIEDLGTVSYVSVVNKNARTLKGFSSNANTRMRPGDDLTQAYFSFFQPYVDYYGVADFGDKICTGGFDGTDVNLLNGDISFQGYSFSGRSQVAKKGSNYINNMLYIQRELYDAIYDCQQGCTTDGCNDDAVHALDEAAAFYVGNQYPDDPDKEGNLFFALAVKRCDDFGVCSNGLTGEAIVNQKVIAEMKALKPKFNSGQCDQVQPGVDEIVRLMMIPLIQGTLRYAERTAHLEQPTEAMQAEGAIFAAAILPLIHKCSTTAAATIYENMKLANGNSKANFADVKAAFESCYSFYNIDCAEVGGVVNETTRDTYVKGGEPCGGVDVFASQGSSASIFSISASATVVGVLGAVAALFM